MSNVTKWDQFHHRVVPLEGDELLRETLTEARQAVTDRDYHHLKRVVQFLDECADYQIAHPEE